MIPPEDLVNYPADNKSDDKKDEEDYQGFFGNHGKHDVGFVSAGGDHGAGKRPKTDRVVCVEPVGGEDGLTADLQIVKVALVIDRLDPLNPEIGEIAVDERSQVVESCLRDIGMDPETGEFDADIVETGTSKNQRDRIKDLKHLIEELEDEYEEGAPLGEVIDRAGTDLGLEEAKAEDEIENLRRKGEVYEPRQNYLRTT